jgi:two-component system sensor histidine kinase BaeS
VWRLGCLTLIFLFLLSGAVGIATRGASHFPLPVFVGAFVLFLLLAAAVQGLRGVAVPVDEIIDAAGKIQGGDYSARIQEGGPRQLRSVARAFNAMSARLQSTDERRRDFLADVVHELRTPLAVIRAQAEAIQDGVHPADQEHLAPIVDATRALEVLVEDLRALALTDTGSLTLHREPVDVVELVRDTVAQFDAQAENASITLSVAGPDALPSADIDPARIRGVIGNVIANAMRHTPSGGKVTVTASQLDERVVIEVADTGEGIEPDLLPHVFDRFVRGPKSRGSGLGLAIAHDIVAAHGGEIDVKSTVGLGTTVRMALPIAK